MSAGRFGDPALYGDRIARIYDRLHGGMDPAAAVETLVGLAADGPALELGIGTGRIALPLGERGVEVHGLDASAAMVERLRGKPGAAGIPVTVGDFADVPVEGPFALVFVAFNTFFGLEDQEAQVRCFRRVAEVLEPGGRFAIEAFVPDPCRFDRGQRVATSTVREDDVQLEASLHDPVGQRVTTQHVVLSEEGVRLYPLRIRYAWPSELDLMARLAGLRLESRWGSWKREPFTADSAAHVSVWFLPG